MNHKAAMWDQRFSDLDFAYGEAPNQFLVEQMGLIPEAGQVLSLGEGEGRNAVWMASKGHRVTAVDFSSVGLAKLLRRAGQAQLSMTATLADIEDYEIGCERWDAVVSVFCLLPGQLQHQTLRRIIEGLRPGGVLILEGYTPRQLAFGTGGPRDPDLLLEPEVVRQTLAGVELVHFEEVERLVWLKGHCIMECLLCCRWLHANLLLSDGKPVSGAKRRKGCVMGLAEKRCNLNPGSSLE